MEFISKKKRKEKKSYEFFWLEIKICKGFVEMFGSKWKVFDRCNWFFEFDLDGDDCCCCWWRRIIVFPLVWDSFNEFSTENSKLLDEQNEFVWPKHEVNEQ